LIGMTTDLIDEVDKNGNVIAAIKEFAKYV
jgi:hypothetical protein